MFDNNSEIFSRDTIESLTNEYVDEAIELLQELDMDIEGLGQSTPDMEAVNRMFRAFHTLKGSSQLMGFINISLLAHKSEDLLGMIRKAGNIADNSIPGLLNKSAGYIRALIDDVSQKKVDRQSCVEMAQLIHDIETTTGKTAVRDSEPEKVPTERKLKILIVEDELVSRLKLEGILSAYGTCHTAVDGVEAVEAFTQDPSYDLIFMDILMPRLDGMGAVSRIRDIERDLNVQPGEEARILVVTAVDGVKEIVKFMYKCGASSYITKPVTPEIIERAMRKLHLSG